MSEERVAKRQRMDDDVSEEQRLRDENEALKAEIVRLKERNHCLEAQNSEQEQEIEILVRKAYPTKGLPSLCLDRILSWCNIKDLFHGCMAVNSEWEQASRREVRTRKCLKIYEMQNMDHGEEFIETDMTVDPFDANLLIVPPSVVGAERRDLIDSLKQMTSVTRLEVENYRYNEYDPLIISMAPTLKSLNLHESELPVKTRRKQRPAVYEQLRDLRCDGVGGGEGTKPFPHLKSFKSGFTETDLRKMPLSLQRLEMDLDLHDYDSVTQQMGALDKLVNLTHLDLDWNFRNEELYDSLILRPFHSFRKLVHLHLNFSGISLDRYLVDAAVESLVDRNPRLKNLELRLFPATDASLVSLARLRRLEKLTLESREKRFTANGILTLLQSLAPSNTLRSVYLGKLKSNYDKHEFIHNVEAIPFPDSRTFEISGRCFSLTI